MDNQQSAKMLRDLAVETFETCLSSVDPEKLVKQIVEIDTTNSLMVINDKFGSGQKHYYPLQETPRILIVGAGKASQQLCKGLIDRLRTIELDNFTVSGYINYPDNQEKLEFDMPSNMSIEMLEATHPIPKESTIASTNRQLLSIDNAQENTLMIALISGGGSSLLESPANGISLEDLQRTNQILLSSGASIQEINTIRKHISQVKSGFLAKRAISSKIKKVIGLYLSDVIGNDLSFVASGPTCPDLTTFKDCKVILDKYCIFSNLPESVQERIQKGLCDLELETPKPDDMIFKSVLNVLIGSSDYSALAAKLHLESKEFKPVNIFSNDLQGEAKIFGTELIDLIDKMSKDRDVEIKYKAAFIGTGEFTVTLTGNGIGGRNQEMLLSFLQQLYIKENHALKGISFCVISCAFDGIEGNSPVTGGIVDSDSVNRLKKLCINDLDKLVDATLQNNDSYTLLNKMGDTISTSGYTGTNVNDMTLILVESSQ